MEAKLIVIDGDALASQYVLQLPTIIGRSRRTDLTLGHPLVSRQHCEVFEANGILMVRDLGSLNGTFVGEMRIAEQAMPLKPGDIISVGPVTFRAVYRAASPPREEAADWDPQNPTLDAPLLDQMDQEDNAGQEDNDGSQSNDDPNDTAPRRQ